MRSPTALVDEVFRLADERYQAIAKVAFPLKAFGRHVVKMRLEDRNRLTPDEFPGKALCLLEQRLLYYEQRRTPRAWSTNLFSGTTACGISIAAAFAQDPAL